MRGRIGVRRHVKRERMLHPLESPQASRSSIEDGPFVLARTSLTPSSCRIHRSLTSRSSPFLFADRVDTATAALTEPLLGLRASILDNLNNTSLEGLDGWDVVGEDTHVTSCGRDVDLRNALGRVEGLLP